MVNRVFSNKKICVILMSVALLVVGMAYPSLEAGAVQLSEIQERDVAITKTSSHVQASDSNNDSITSTGIFFEKTSIIEFTNNSNVAIKSFTLWLGRDYTFESFKAEKGWTGKKTPSGTIILTASGQLNLDESVKFGVKTNMPNPAINWSAKDRNGDEIKVGRTVTDAPKTPEPDPEPDPGTSTPINGVLSDSKFRIIPEKPNTGSTIRVAGEKFGASHQFSFYIDTTRLGTFLSDENGNFVTTMQIPDEQKADRVDFRIIDENGNEKRTSLRLGEAEDRIPETDNVRLTIQGLPSILHRGDVLEISGTAKPGSTVIASVKNSEGDEIFTRTAVVDSKGNWELPEPEIIPLDAEFGKYSAEISDGRESILRAWEVESSKVIIIQPDNLKYDLGDTIRYVGTALPNRSIELVLEDPIGKTIASDIIETDSSGNVEFEYKTDNNSTKGTYTLVVTQNGHKEFIFAGLGQLPEIPVNLEFDKLNYRTGEIAIISMTGQSSDIVSLLIINPAGRAVPLVESEEIAGDGPVLVMSDSEGGAVFLQLRPDGRGTYSIDLDRYSSGAYTAVLSKGTAKSTENFTVGLEIGGEIKQINTTKNDYKPGDSILVLGQTNPNVFLTISLIDPDGEQVRVKNTFSSEDGRISESSFNVPSDAKPGSWIIRIQSGNNVGETKINVARIQEGLTISAEEEILDQNLGKSIRIHVMGAAKQQTVMIEIIAPNGEIYKKLKFPATSEGVINQPWIIPKDAEPGIYTIKAEQMQNTAQTTYEIK